MTTMPTTDLTLRKCGDGYYRTSWTDQTGQPRQKSFGKHRGRAMNRFAAFRARWSSDPTARTPDAGGVLTVQAAWDAYLDHAKAHYRLPDGSPSTGIYGPTAGMRVALGLFADHPAAAFSPADLRACQVEMVRLGWSAATVNDRVRKVRQVWRWLASHEMVPAGTWHALQAVEPVQAGRGVRVGGKTIQPAGRAPVPAVAGVVVGQTLEHLPPTLAALVRFQMLTGCRPAEAVALEATDLDCRGSVWLYRPRRHKTQHHGHARTVLVGPQAQDVLRPFLAFSGPLFNPMRAERERDDARRAAYQPGATTLGDYRTWPTYLGRERRPIEPAGYTPTAYARAIARCCRDHGIQHWSPNQLRHAAATRLRREFGLDVAQVVLGHARADVTQVYAEVEMAKASAAIARIG